MARRNLWGKPAAVFLKALLFDVSIRRNNLLTRGIHQKVTLTFMSSRFSRFLKEVIMADIVDTAVGAGSFKTLVAAVTAAGLVDTLKVAGPFTVLAPADTAFAKLPA